MNLSKIELSYVEQTGRFYAAYLTNQDGNRRKIGYEELCTFFYAIGISKPPFVYYFKEQAELQAAFKAKYPAVQYSHDDLMDIS